jgi:addiction module HigA family antidote
VSTRKVRHPGEVLERDFMVPAELSANALAREIGVPPNRVSSIVNGSRGISADTALRLARYFKTTPEYWMELWITYELAIAKEEIGREIFDIKPSSVEATA